MMRGGYAGDDGVRMECQGLEDEECGLVEVLWMQQMRNLLGRYLEWKETVCEGQVMVQWLAFRV